MTALFTLFAGFFIAIAIAKLFDYLEARQIDNQVHD